MFHQKPTRITDWWLGLMFHQKTQKDNKLLGRSCASPSFSSSIFWHWSFCPLWVQTTTQQKYRAYSSWTMERLCTLPVFQGPCSGDEASGSPLSSCPPPSSDFLSLWVDGGMVTVPAEKSIFITVMLVTAINTSGCCTEIFFFFKWQTDLPNDGERRMKTDRQRMCIYNQCLDSSLGICQFVLLYLCKFWLSLYTTLLVSVLAQSIPFYLCKFWLSLYTTLLV